MMNLGQISKDGKSEQKEKTEVGRVLENPRVI